MFPLTTRIFDHHQVIASCSMAVQQQIHFMELTLRINASRLDKTWPLFRRRCFQMHFREWKYKITEVCSWGFNWQHPNISLDNGFAPNWQPAIIWTSSDPVQWRTYAVLRGDELRYFRERHYERRMKSKHPIKRYCIINLLLSEYIYISH